MATDGGDDTPAQVARKIKDAKARLRKELLAKLDAYCGTDDLSWMYSGPVPIPVETMVQNFARSLIDEM